MVRIRPLEEKRNIILLCRRKNGMRDRLYPLLFEPIFKEKIWGGQRLKTVLNKCIPGDKPIGESWEISDHGEDSTIILNGRLKGRSLGDLWKECPDRIAGPGREWSRFPLLLKFIDASDVLSVQVHPADDYAMKNEGDLGKTECWYILDAGKNNKIYRGLKPGVNREMFKYAIQSEDLEKCMIGQEVRRGDVIFLPAGTVHAIGGNILLAEIQQNSDTTYRVYDWGRVGLDGKPRALHIEKALEVTNFGDQGSFFAQQKKRSEKETVLVDCEKFTFSRLTLKKSDSWSTSRKDCFIFTVISGDCVLETEQFSVEIKTGNSLLIPYAVDGFSLNALEKSEILKMIPKDG